MTERKMLINRYISDWHYGHKNVLAYDARPFTTVDEMNEELIRLWNKVTMPEDTVYMLGDMFWCRSGQAYEVLQELNGDIVLVRGNHDSWVKTKCRNRFKDIVDYVEVQELTPSGNLTNVALMHYALPSFKNAYYGAYHFYGYVHNSFEWNMMEHHRYLIESLYDKPCNMINVGAMMPYIGYAPRTFSEIVDGYAAWKEGDHH